MTRYHNIEQESSANLNEWSTSIANPTKFEQFSATLPSATFNSFLKLLYFNNQYVLFCNAYAYYYSSNLTDWTFTQNSNMANIIDVIVNNDYLYVITPTAIYATNNLTSWKSTNSNTFGLLNHFVQMQAAGWSSYAICIGDNIDYAYRLSFGNVAGKPNPSFTKTNSFRSVTGATTPIIWAGDRYFFSNTSSPYCYYSFDGMNWVEVKLPFEVSSATGYYIQDISGTTGKYYIIGDRINHVYYTSDFRTWENVSIPGELNYLRPHLFYHETLNEMVGIHQQYGLWFQEDVPTKFTTVGPPRSEESKQIVWDGLCYNGEKYIVWSATRASVNVYFATISDAYKDTNLSYVLSMLLQKMDETNNKLQALIDKE